MLTIVCIYCREVKGQKKGHGVAGVSSTICPPCMKVHHPEVFRIMQKERNEKSRK